MALSKPFRLFTNNIFQTQIRGLASRTDNLRQQPVAKPKTLQPNQYENVQSSLYETQFHETKNLFIRAYENLSIDSNSKHLECAITGRAFTHAETYDACLRWPAMMKRAVPSKQKPTVALIMPNSPEFIVAFLGSQAAGSIVTTINPTYTPMEVAQHIIDSKSDVVVVDALLEPLINGTLKVLGKTIPVLINGKSTENRPNIQEIIWNKESVMEAPVDVKSSDIAWIPYSSGTSGKPKGTMISHEALASSLDMITEDFFVTQTPTSSGHGCQIGILPFFHIYGMIVQGKMQHFGNTTITMPTFNPQLFVATLKKNQVTHLFVVPPILQFMVGHPSVTKEDLQFLTSVTIGGAPVPRPLVEGLKAKLGRDILFLEGFGMTEVGFSHITSTDSGKVGYCGRLLPGVSAKVIDMETGQALPANTPGEMCLKTPAMMSGYLNNPEATADAIDSDGWFHTGDVACYTECGHFSIVDRIKELIKVKGLQVSPSELEETLMSHPGVKDAGVIGTTDPRLGEAPKAFVVRSNPDLSETDVHAFMKERLSKHKQLEGGVYFVDELPKSQTGKLERRKLKDM